MHSMASVFLRISNKYFGFGETAVLNYRNAMLGSALVMVRAVDLNSPFGAAQSESLTRCDTAGRALTWIKLWTTAKPTLVPHGWDRLDVCTFLCRLPYPGGGAICILLFAM
jgi:hypothetical protein